MLLIRTAEYNAFAMIPEALASRLPLEKDGGKPLFRRSAANIEALRAAVHEHLATCGMSAAEIADLAWSDDMQGIDRESRVFASTRGRSMESHLLHAADAWTRGEQLRAAP